MSSSEDDGEDDWLLGGGGATTALARDWEELEDEERAAALLLGYEAPTGDDDGDDDDDERRWPYHKFDRDDDLGRKSGWADWSGLSDELRAAAQTLGLDPDVDPDTWPPDTEIGGDGGSSDGEGGGAKMTFAEDLAAR